MKTIERRTFLRMTGAALTAAALADRTGAIAASRDPQEPLEEGIHARRAEQGLALGHASSS